MKNIVQTKKQLFKEIARFLLVGGLATAVDYAIAYLFFAWFLPPEFIGERLALILSTALGFGAGLLVNWILSVRFVFQEVRDREKAASKSSFFRFTIIGIIGLFLTELGMLALPLLPDITLFSRETFLNLSWTWWLLKGVMTLIVLIWNYLGRKIFIFKT